MGLIYRIIVAVICVLFAFRALPLVLSVLELSVDGNVLALVKLCIGALAILYILFGRWPAGGPTWS